MNLFKTRRLMSQGHLSLFGTNYQDRLGSKKQWVFASRNDPPKLTSGRFDRPDAVVIAATHAERRAVVVIEEFRVPLGGYQYGFPAGLVDPGETIEDAAVRELKEETGLDLVRISKISPPIYSSSGMTDESISMVFCECSGAPSADANEASEDITVHFVDQDDARELCIDADARVDAKAWLVLYGFAMTGMISG
ncbi:MAG: NUDIX hydrolase [Desulfobacterales bacterium]|jgi:ADP-ribose pyrophosphatase